MIEFHCTNCGQEISISEIHAGKKVKCSKCEYIITIPEAENLQSITSQSNANGPETPTISDLDPLVFDIPQKSETTTELISQNDVYGRTFEAEWQREERPRIDDTEPFGQRKLPWLIDIFLYPTSMPGLTNLAIFIAVPLLIRALERLLGTAALVLVAPSVIINILVGLYMYWYIAECVRESAGGGLRAPQTLHNHPSLNEMFSQVLNMFGCLIFFLGPVMFYILFARKTDWVFWVLLSYGAIFFPMGLLAILIFDSFSGLNPILLVRSIFRTFLPYCGLILIICGTEFIFRSASRMQQSYLLAFVLRCARIYLLLVAAHLLGRFFWRYEEKLDWEV